MTFKQVLSAFVNCFITRIVIGVLVITAVYMGCRLLVFDAAQIVKLPVDAVNFFVEVIPPFFVVFVYVVLYGVYEHRYVHELSTKTMGLNLFFGLFWGVVLQMLVFLVLALFADMKILSVNNVMSMLPAFSLAFSAAVFEEIVCRGVLFRLLEEKLGSYIAIVVSALIFGMLHMANPGASIWIALALALQAGVLLSVAYVYSRSLWFPIAIHFAWNFVQSGIFGANLSGNEMNVSLLTTHIEGSEWVTGGVFGIETSVQATVVCLIMSITLLVLSIKKKRIVAPWWVQKRNGFLQSESQSRFL